MCLALLGLTTQDSAARQGGLGQARYMPREFLVFPNELRDVPAIRRRLRDNGYLILAQAPTSGMLLVATPAGIPGLEDFSCQWVRTWPGVRAAERNLGGESFQPVCPFDPTPDTVPCTEYPDLQAACQGILDPLAPNDPAFCFQWGLDNVGQIVVDRTCTTGCWSQTGVPGIDINLLAAWQRTAGRPEITVAILDSGVETCNPDLDPSRRFYPEIALTCVGNDGPQYPCCNIALDPVCVYGDAGDNNGHGTIIASIVGAKANNNLGIAGIDQQCKILAGRIFTELDHGLPSRPNHGRAIVALELIASDPVYDSVRVINISFGLLCSVEEEIQQEAALRMAAAVLASQNRFLVAAAGNSGVGEADLYCLGQIPETILVGGIDARGWRFGAGQPVSCDGFSSNTGSQLDFVAPGIGIVAAICQSNPCPDCPNRPFRPYNSFPCDDLRWHHNFVKGTSFAAPMVSGAISLILAHATELNVLSSTTWSGLTWQDVYDLLKDSARDRVSWSGCTPSQQGDPADTCGWDSHYGWGLIDIDRALCLLEERFAGGPTCPPKSPTPCCP